MKWIDGIAAVIALICVALLIAIATSASDSDRAARLEAHTLLTRCVSDSTRWVVLDSVRAERDSVRSRLEDSLLTLRVRLAVSEAELRAVELSSRRDK